MYRSKIFSMLILVILPVMTFAGTVGKIKGKVTDMQSGEPLAGANIVVTGTTFGAATDAKGEFVILNLEAGTYQLKASFIGYKAMTFSNIRVNADLTTELKIELPSNDLQVSTIEVLALKPLVNKSSTNASRITTSEDISTLPVRGLNSIIGMSAGVTLQDNNVFIRGGRVDEVGFYLEGVSITNPLTGGRGVTIVQDAVEEIQVQAGGYTAEFGGANSGIIRQQLKTGPKNYKITLDYTTDNITLKSKDTFFDGKKRLGSHWYGYNEMTATVGGPIYDERFRFFGLFNYNYKRDNDPQPYPGINLGKMVDPTTQDSINLVYPAGATFGNSQQTFTYTGTFTMDLKPFILRFAGTYTSSKGYTPFNSHRNAGNISNILNTARIEEVLTTDASGSLKLTHILTSDMFYELNIGYFSSTLNRYDPYLKDDFMAYGDSIANARVGFNTFTSRYARPQRISMYDFAFNGHGDVLAGYVKRKSENISLSGALSIIEGKVHTIKIGGELQRYTIRNFSLGNERVFSIAGIINDRQLSNDELSRIMVSRGVNAFGYDPLGNETNSDGIYAPKHPVFAAFYLQDKIELEDIILNLGLRYDYINTDNKQLIDPTRPEKTFNYNSGEVYIDGLSDVPAFHSVSPRIGISFPVTDRTVFHAQYGKFVQQTRLLDIYQGLPATGDNLRGGLFINFPIGFNVRPTRTTQYEIGFTQQVGDFASVDITGYYKDVKDQVVYDQQSTHPSSPYKAYSVYKNGDFATTKGLELSFNMRRFERIALNASLSFQDAQGTGSFPNSSRGVVGAPLDNVTIFRPQYITPLEFNKDVTASLNIDYRFGKDDSPFKALEEFGTSLLFTYNSGHPYTKGIGGADLEGDARDRRPIEPLNSSVTPSYFQVDLKMDKSFKLFDKISLNVYLFVINLFDRKNIENLFLRTGSTTDDGYLSNPKLSGDLGRNPAYAKLYRAINIDYYERYQNANGPMTVPFFYGPPRQIRLGFRLEY